MGNNKRRTPRKRNSLIMTTAPFIALAINGGSVIRINTAKTFALDKVLSHQMPTHLNNLSTDHLFTIAFPLKSKYILRKTVPINRNPTKTIRVS